MLLSGLLLAGCSSGTGSNGGGAGGESGMSGNTGQGGNAGAIAEAGGNGGGAKQGGSGGESSGIGEGTGGVNATGGGKATGGGSATGGSGGTVVATGGAGGTVLTPPLPKAPKYTQNFDSLPSGQAPGAPFSGAKGDVKIDETRAFSGKKSLRVFVPTGSFTDAGINFATRSVLPGTKKKYYVRFMVYFETSPLTSNFSHYDLVAFNGPQKGDGITLNGFYGFGGFNNNGGSQKVQIYGNTTTGKTADCAKDAPLALGEKKWQCVEMKIDEDEVLNYGTSIDGKELQNFSFPYNFAGANCVPGQNPTNGNWYIPEITSTRFGFRNVFVQEKPMAVYFDDIAWSDAPIGCPKP